MPEHFDLIVIGSGAGGATLAHALAPTGKRILILERGDYLHREKQNWDATEVWIKHRYRNSGNWTDQEGGAFLPKQHYYVGGNTKMYGAVLFRKREQDFGRVQHVDGVSGAWPITYADLEPYYTRAEQLYHVHGERKVDPTEPWTSGPFPYPAMSHEPRVELLSGDLERAGLHPFHLPLGIMIDEDDPRHSPCIRCDTCDGFPCLVGAKAEAHVVCVEPALRHPNVSLRTGAFVRRLETDGVGRRVSKVVVDRDGEPEEYTADVVVLSAGAINSAAVLLRSASDAHPDGLGNGSGAVGRHLMLHNNSALTAFSTVPNSTLFQKTLGVNDYYFGDGEWDFPLGAMQMLGRSDPATIRLNDPKGEAGDPEVLGEHSIDFWITTEDLGRWENRVVAGPDGSIRLEYTPSNLAAHSRLIGKFKGLLETMQCRDDVVFANHYLGGRLGIGGVAHQNGTVRFGHDAATSALDVHCRMHEVDNLYVVDSSFFVSSSAVNPTLTIIANALRVADHLAERLGARPEQAEV
jgi:choline dehydrogenase-like flavoprotein